MEALGTLIKKDYDNVVFTDARTGVESTIDLSRIGPLWQLKQRMTNKELEGLKWDRIGIISQSAQEEVLNKQYASVYLDDGETYNVVKKARGLNVATRVDLLRAYHGMIARHPTMADATINETKDLALIEYTEDDDDHMFSQSEATWWWLYDIAKMERIPMLGQDELKYKYLHNSSGIRERGVERVDFDAENPHRVVITMVAEFNEEPAKEFVDWQP